MYSLFTDAKIHVATRKIPKNSTLRTTVEIKVTTLSFKVFEGRLKEPTIG